MSNVGIWGFDDHDAAGLAYEWVVTGSPTIQTGMTGQHVRLTDGQIIRRLLPAAATYTLGFRMRVSTIPSGTVPFLQIAGPYTGHLILQLTAQGALNLYLTNRASISDWGMANGATKATGATLLAANTEYYIELKITISNAAGTYDLRINGSASPEFSGSSTDTCFDATGNTATWNSFAFGGSTYFGNLDIDDIYINDTAGTVCNSFLGDCQVDSHFPTADGDLSGWTPSTGGSHYAVVDENPQNTSDYLSTNTLNAEETFDCEDFKNNGADIYVVSPVVLAKKTEAGTCGIALLSRESGADSAAGTVYPSSVDWNSYQTPISLAVGDAKRAAVGFNAAQYGFQKVA